MFGWITHSVRLIAFALHNACIFVSGWQKNILNSDKILFKNFENANIISVVKMCLVVYFINFFIGIQSHVIRNSIAFKSFDRFSSFEPHQCIGNLLYWIKPFPRPHRNYEFFLPILNFVFYVSENLYNIYICMISVTS